MRTRSGCARLAAARSGRSHCPSPGRTTCWCAPCARASAAAPRRWCSGAPCRQGSTPRCERRSRRGTSRARSSTATSTSGTVEQGPPELRGRTVFCLYPHQTAYVVPASAVTVVPEDVPPARAVLAGTVETAVNALWDAGATARRPGHRRRGRDGRLLRRSPAEPLPGDRRSRSWTSMPAGPRSPPRSASTSRCRTTPPAIATWSCTPARRPPGSSGRSSCSRPRAR